ncbi:MAG: DnaJ domain-containing protein [Coriobacteriaceae bacterium]|jgi:curved DNA-binding protein CbpA|nr:DnaJ domain-containing protein [Coriobacteriaceae bacterium]
MNRTEALRALGLDEDADIADIKAAYKEMAQILHPDRFATSKKLQDRATEQFKNLQEAYDYLTSNKRSSARRGARSSGTPGASGAGQTAQGSTRPSSARYSYEARLAGIAAARTQLVAQRDALLDSRRNGIIVAAVGVLVVLVFRHPIIMALGPTAAVWGIVQVISAQTAISSLTRHIQELNKEHKRVAQELEDIDNTP